MFSFQFFTTFECRKALNKLNENKPLDRSTIPAWALNDGAHILAELICFLFNGFLKQNKISFSIEVGKYYTNPQKKRHWKPAEL